MSQPEEDLPPEIQPDPAGDAIWPDHREAEILGVCALRFDGYRYGEDHGIDLGELIHRRVPSNRWDDLSTPEQMAAFFMVQRTIRWVDYVTSADPLYRAFRTLFLRLYAEPVPEVYRAAVDDAETGWDGRPQAEREAAVELVRSIHETVKYDVS